MKSFNKMCAGKWRGIYSVATHAHRWAFSTRKTQSVLRVCREMKFLRRNAKKWRGIYSVAMHAHRWAFSTRKTRSVLRVCREMKFLRWNAKEVARNLFSSHACTQMGIFNEKNTKCFTSL